KVAQLFSNARSAYTLSTLISVDQAFGQADASIAAMFRKLSDNTIGQVDTRMTIARDPVMREVLLSTEGLTPIGAMPLLHGIVKGVLNVGSVRGYMIESPSDYYAWAAIAMGQKVSDDSLDTARLDALRYKAI